MFEGIFSPKKSEEKKEYADGTKLGAGHEVVAEVGAEDGDKSPTQEKSGKETGSTIHIASNGVVITPGDTEDWPNRDIHEQP